MNQQESTMMTAEKTKLQKLQTLLNSATNERQRKMYQALLDKAKAELASESAPPQQKTTQTSTKKQAQSKSSKKKAESNPPVSKQTSSKKKTTSKKEKASSNNSVVVTEEISATNQSTSVAPTNQTKQDKKSATTKTKAKAKKQSKKSKSSNNATSSDQKEQLYFSGVGIIRCTPYLEDEKVFVTINEQQCALKQAVETERKGINLLKEELEKNGSREMLLRVYPNITHHSDGRPPSHSFRLVQFYLDEERYSELPEEFIFRGIWRVVPHCPYPVITIYRNINRYAFYKRLSKYAKERFVKSQDFPLVWDAPVEPYKHYPAKEKSEQMPCYFVQVRAIFKDAQYIVTEMLSEPTLDIPQFIEPKRIPNNQNQSKQSEQPNQLDNKEFLSNTEVVKFDEIL